MNLRGAIELLAGILVWIGFLMSLPIYGWLVWGVLRRFRNLGRGDRRAKGKGPDVSTGRLLRRRDRPNDRMTRSVLTPPTPRLFHRWHRALPQSGDCAVMEPAFGFAQIR